MAGAGYVLLLEYVTARGAECCPGLCWQLRMSDTSCSFFGSVNAKNDVIDGILDC